MIGIGIPISQSRIARMVPPGTSVSPKATRGINSRSRSGGGAGVAQESPCSRKADATGVVRKSARKKKGVRCRYYVNQSLTQRGRPQADGAACRVPAADLEAIAEGQVCRILQNEAAVYKAISAATPKASARKRLIAETGRAGAALDRAGCGAEAVEIAVRLSALADLSQTSQPGLEPTSRTAEIAQPPRW